MDSDKFNEIGLKAKKSALEILGSYWKSGVLPIDPREIGINLNIRFMDIYTPDNIAGGIWKRRDYPPTIFLNKNDAFNERRFTMAHELGHFYLRQIEDNSSEYESLDFRDDFLSDKISEEEFFSNIFAGELLMPEELVIEHYTNSKSVVSVSKEFRVTINAVKFRLAYLGLL